LERDEEWVVAAPDRAAELDDWVLATAPRAAAYARSLLRDVHQAEDIVQECYCRLLKKADVYDLPRDGLKLLLTAITNACINLRTRRRPMFPLFRGGDSDDPGAPDILDPRVDGPADVVIGRELESVIAAALSGLPQAQRAAIQLRSIGYSQQEIAEIMSVSASNAGVLIHRARQALARHLTPYLGEEKVI
jgi:RNA polymerase sigma-70 factor (ECF subfamily)